MTVSYKLNGFGSIDALISHYIALHPGGLYVDLGCGYYKPQGYIGIDNMIGERSQVASGTLPDIIMDLGQAIPLPNISCAGVRASHFLEHSNVPHILDETWRLLRPGGEFTITVPYANSAEGMYPGHTIFFTEKWFHLNIQFQQQFEIQNIQYKPSDTYEKEMPEYLKGIIPFDIARRFMFNVCNEMTMTTRVKK